MYVEWLYIVPGPQGARPAGHEAGSEDKVKAKNRGNETYWRLSNRRKGE